MPDGINFNPPANSNNAVMVNNSNQLRNPTATALLEANPEIAKASDMTNYNAAITSLEKKTQNMTATIGRTYFAGTLAADYIEGAGGGGGGDIEGDVTVDSLLSKSIIQANYYGDIESEDYIPNKFAKGWRLAWRNNYDSDAGTADLYLVDDEDLRFSGEDITGGSLPDTFAKGNIQNLSVNDVLYFFNNRHFPKAFYITAKNDGQGYITVKEIMRNSLVIDTSVPATGFRYGMFVVGSINTGTGVITYSNTKVDYGKINLTESSIINGYNCGVSISTLINGINNLNFGSYSSNFGRDNTVLSYTSAAFGQQNTVFGEKSFAFGTKNNIDADIGNAVFGANNAIVPDSTWQERTDFSRYDTCFISGNSNEINLNNSITAQNGTYLGLFGVGLKGIQTVYPQFITGRYNDTNVSNMLEVVGNGTADNARSNAYTLDKDGNAVFAGSGTFRGGGTFGGDVTDGYGNVLRTIASAPTQLMQTKLNAGALHIANGEATNSTLEIPETFSLAVIVSPDYTGKIITLGALSISAASGTITADDGVDGVSVAGSTTQPNVVVFMHSPTNSVLTVNGVSDAYALAPISGTGYTVGSSTSASGAVSNLKIFNFDITAAGAPYTLDDYTAGKPVPPSLKGAFYQDIRANYAGYIQRYSTPSVSFVNGSNLELTVSDDSTSSAIDQYIAWKLPRKIKAGEKIKVSGRIILKTQTGSGYYGIQLFLLTTATSWSTGRQGVSTSQSGNILTINAEYTLTGDAEYFGIMRSMNQGTGDKQYEIESFSVEVSGETLALENYTIVNGGTQTIFDVAGCAQDATVSAGSIAGDNDIRVARLVDFISAI